LQLELGVFAFTLGLGQLAVNFAKIGLEFLRLGVFSFLSRGKLGIQLFLFLS